VLAVELRPEETCRSFHNFVGALEFSVLLLKIARTIRTAAAFSSGLYLRVVGFPGDCSFGMAPSSFPRSGASMISRAFQTVCRDAEWVALPVMGDDIVIGHAGF